MKRRLTRAKPLKLALSTLSLLPAIASSALVIDEDFESGLAAWSTSGSWGVETASIGSPTKAATESPTAFYLSSSDTALTLGNGMDLGSLSSVAVAFTHAYDLESGYDYASVEISSNGGSSWTAIGSYTGSAASAREQLDMSSYAGMGSVLIRFRVVTDASIVKEGWQVDDIKIGQPPAAVTLSTPVDIGQNHVGLSWSASADPAFSAYRILRSQSASFDWREADVLAEISASATTTYTDITTVPKTTYYYKVMVLTTDDLHSMSNEISATTLTGMDYPFLDNAEGGSGAWNADAPWAITTEQARSGSSSWSDSPSTDYADGISAQSLTLSAPMDLSTATDPVWTFWFRCDLISGDFGYAEVSTDGGSSWTALATLSNSENTSEWQQGRISLSSYLLPNVLLRFRLTTNASNTADGIYLDDISVAEAPTAMGTPIVTSLDSHSLTVSWSASTHPQLDHYVLYRAQGSTVGLNDDLIATVNAGDPLTHDDSGLSQNTDYAYRVYAVSKYGTHSADSPSAAAIHTLSQPIPLAEDFEGTDIRWTFVSDNANPSTWAISDDDARNGTYCLTDSPGAGYEPSRNSYAETSVDLSGSAWPILSFWDKVDLNTGDWVRVEIVAEGKSTYYLYGARESGHTDWRQQRIDLSYYKGHAEVRIRFRLASDGGATSGNGWFIDDIAIMENPDAGTAATLPITEDFEAASLQDRWIAAGWHTETDAQAQDGTQSARSGDGSLNVDDSRNAMILDQPIVLAAGSNVQATFWAVGELQGYGYFRLLYSTNGGASWSELSDVNLNYNDFGATVYTRMQADLSGLEGETIRLKFEVSSSNHTTARINIDKLTIAEMPAAVNLLSAVPSLRSVDLTWDSSTLGSDFVRYEVWQSTSADVSVRNGQKIFETTDVGTVTTTDSDLNIGSTYYYKVFVVDQRDTYIPSNEIAATTVPVVLPMSDTMDTLDSWVTGSNNGASPDWSVVTTDPHEGSGYIGSVSTGHYAQNSDTYMETAVDLSGTTWPILSFWDKLDLNTGDWVRVEIYASGKSTYYLYGARESGHADWRQQRIDLSYYKGHANVLIRFRLFSDNNPTTAEGWFIDDLAIMENPDAGTAATLPITEDFEAASLQDRWIASGWHTETDAQAQDGTQSARSGDGSLNVDDSRNAMILDQPIVLAAGSNVQATFWAVGELQGYGYFRLLYSTNGGASWSELSDVNLNYYDFGATVYTRMQADLSGLEGETIWLKFEVSSSNHTTARINIDKLTIAEMPAAVNLLSAVPSLRSVDLTWDSSTLGSDFVRYEVWQSTSANVSLSNGQKIFETTDSGTTSTTDSDLSIGSAYYYKVYSVDKRDTYIPSNELTTTTVPLSLPVSDTMDTLDSWVTGSNNGASPDWSVVTTDPHEGSGYIGSVSTGHYAQNSDTYMETAVDLSGTTWPILSFWDKLDLNTGDWVRVEIYASGKSTYYLYGARESGHADWRQQRIDLSYYKGHANVLIRFRLFSDNNPTTAEGWFIDDIAIMENPDAGTAATLPITEDFEAASLQDRWIASGWHTETDAQARDGTQSARSVDGNLIVDDSRNAMILDQPIVLAAGSNVQATFWAVGELQGYGYFRLLYSTNGGASWSELSDVNLNYYDFGATVYTRMQADLSGLEGETIWLKFEVSSSNHTTARINIDKLTIAEMPQEVLVQPIDQIGVTSMRINWHASTLSSFAKYRIYRSNGTTVNTGSTLLAEIDTQATASFTDTGLDARTAYYYKIYTVDDRDTLIPSDTVSARTLGLTLPLAIDFETDLNGWTRSGDWQLLDGVGRGGGQALVDSVGDYQPSTQTSAIFAVDLTGMDWPVLKFWDKHDFAGGSYGRVEISTNGTSWGNYIYGVTGLRDEWHEQSLDLSQWKNSDTVFIKFFRATDGNLGDGWLIDDLSIADNTNAPLYPVWDGFETDSGLWLKSRWSRSTDNPRDGSYCLHDSPEGRYAEDSLQRLILAHDLDLTGATDPTLSFYIRGTLVGYSYFRVHISTDEGLTWSEVSPLNVNYNTWNSPDTWERKQYSLSGYVGQTIRMKFETSTTNQANSDFYIDNIGIGEAAPAAPTLYDPVDQASVDVLRPTLTVTNAIDYQSDALTYHFQVFEDEALTSLAREVLAVASGAAQTSWQVDSNLQDNSTYWWRARANDGAVDSPWSDTWVFFVNEDNEAPNVINHAGPPDAATLYDSDEWLVWLTASDPDVGDLILDYSLQIDDDPAFGSPMVSLTGLTTDVADPGVLVGMQLSSMAGAENLTAGRWYWRVQARDDRFAEGAWPASPPSFRIASDYEHWLVASFSVAEQDNPAVSGENSDKDGDGVPLMVEFGCAMDTSVSSQEGAPEQVMRDIEGVTHMAVEFDRLIGTDLVFTLEASDDMLGWSTTTATVEVLHDIDGVRERCRLTDPSAIGEKRFIRLSVSLPD